MSYQRLYSILFLLNCFVLLTAQTEYVQNITVNNGEVHNVITPNNIETSGDVIVNSGGILNLLTTQSITLQSGFEIATGALFNAEIKIAVMNPVETDMDMNWTEVITYDEFGLPASWSKNYSDGLGKSLQSQLMDMVTYKPTVQQTLYDDFQRPAISTMAVPVNKSTISYIDNFVLNTDGTAYTAANFDGTKKYSPDPVGTQENTLGWYYSSSNTGEPYVDHTSYPYSRTDYSKTMPGIARKSTIAGDPFKLGTGREVKTYTLPAGSNELGRFLSFDSEIECENLTKTITVGTDGKQSIVYKNADGNIIATSVHSGTGSTTSSINVYKETGFNYIDINVPAGPGFIVLYPSGNSYINKIIDLENDENLNVTAGSSSYGGLSNGFYRVFVSASTQYIGYQMPDNMLTAINIYNEAGQIIRSYSPKAVEDETPQICTKYYYDGYRNLMKIESPDEGTSHFIYRKDGQIRFSQNAQQNADNKFSYTDYDEYARPIESGEFIETSSVYFFDSNDNIALTGETVLPGGRDASSGNTNRSQRYKTWYDEDGNEKNQKFVNNSVSKSEYEGYVTWYSYTYDGKVDWVIRKFPVTYNIGEKRIDYTYDFFGNVTEVAYQKGNSDGFTHYYDYDDNQSLTAVYTQRYGEAAKTLQAKYYYYTHGHLKRVELAGNLQGIDYVYNINGMLKSINHPELSSTLDPGHDGSNGFTTDVFGMTLDYYSGDYTGNSTIKTAYGITSNYNGNIAMMRWGHKNLAPYIASPTNGSQWAYKYAYNDRNYIVDARFGEYNYNSNSYSENTYQYRLMDLLYDANGNIISYQRTGPVDGFQMDDVVYNYESDHKSRLSYITDNGQTGSGGVPLYGDIYNQSPGNYQYNLIGQLVSSVQNNKVFEYDVTGKVIQIKNSSNVNVGTYEYDDAGFRATTKKYSNESLVNHYVRDISGNIMVVYNSSGNAIEYPVYGIGRIGVAFNNSGTLAYQYEIADHLGNVRATVSKDDADHLVSYCDYYPFGWRMPQRKYTSSNTYRFGYQGQFAEKDEESGYNQFEARLYDPRIGRWLTTDPAGQFYSPYVGMGNDPVNGVDPDGRKWFQNGNDFEWFTGLDAIKAWFSSDWKMTPNGGTTTNFGNGWTYTSAPGTTYGKIPMYLKPSDGGLFKLNPAYKGPFEGATIKAFKPNWAGRFEESEIGQSFIGNAVYGVIDDGWVYMQAIVTVPSQVTHLNGAGLEGQDLLNAGVNTITNFVPIGKAGSLLKIEKKAVNACVFNRMFKETGIYASKDGGTFIRQFNNTIRTNNSFKKTYLYLNFSVIGLGAEVSRED